MAASKSAAAEVRSHADPRRPTPDAAVASFLALAPAERSELWATCTELVMRMVAPDEVVGIGTWSGRGRNLGRATRSALGPKLTRCGPHLFVSTGVQTDRVLEPIIDRLDRGGDRRAPVAIPRLTMLGSKRALGDARRWTEIARDWLASLGQPPVPGMEEELTKVAILARRWEAHTADGFRGVKTLTVATQHNSSTRVLLDAARKAEGIATCYVPHAPVADNAFYRDLPCHFGLLRGAAEVQFYERLGAPISSPQLRVVGTPGGAAPLDVRFPSADHLVYAPSTYGREVLEADVAVISSGCDRPVEVCPHPRMKPADLEGLFPVAWTVHPPGPTLPRLRERGAFALVQHGSGVGLEALAGGIEVIDLCAAGERPNYPYLAAPWVQVVSDDQAFAAAISSIEDRAAAERDRVEYARSWNHVSSVASEELAVDVLNEVAAQTLCHDVVLDGWGCSNDDG